jgi:uncharacterized protein with NAD-binding domain and iron-sulfur cluster
MKNLTTVLVLAVAVMFAASCAKKASTDDCRSACAKQVELAKAENPTEPPEDLVVKATGEADKKIAELQAAQLAEIQKIDEECQAAAAALPEEEKAKAAEDCNVKKTDKAGEFAPQFVKANEEKAQAIEAATQAMAKADADRKAQMDKDLQACVDKCVKDRTSKAKADCQIKAATLADFGKCK